VVLSTGLAGCGVMSSSKDEPSGEELRPSSPYVLDGCVRRDDGDLLSLPNIGGAPPTQGVLLGDPRRAVIFTPTQNRNVCEWLSFAQDLAARGYGAALYNHNGNTPPDQQLASVVAEVRTRGAKSVVLVGAADGACTSLASAAAIVPKVNGVVAISPNRQLTGEESIADEVRRLWLPLLFASASVDAGNSALAARAYEAVAPGTDNQVVVVGGSSQGVDLLASADGAQVQAAVEAFLKAHSAT
jgi:hypothetical protein